jgi:hypothetical protein
VRIFVGRFAAAALAVAVTVAASGCGNDDVSSPGAPGSTKSSIGSNARSSAVPGFIFAHKIGTLPHDRSGSPGTVVTSSCANLGAGYVAVGGGYVEANGSTVPALLYADGPGLVNGTPATWVIKGWSDSDSKTGTYDVWVTCSKG